MTDWPDDEAVESVGVAVVTISSTPSIEDDSVGDALVDTFEDGDHDISIRELITKDHDNVQSKLARLVDRDDVDIIVTAGGTGIESEDATLEAVRPLLEKELPAFVDLFHERSYEEIGTRVVSSRALAGVANGVAIFCLPNSVPATRLASESIIVPELPRLVTLLRGTDEE